MPVFYRSDNTISFPTHLGMAPAHAETEEGPGARVIHEALHGGGQPEREPGADAEDGGRERQSEASRGLARD